jgi:outer membrane lipoprotein LolB
MKPLPELKLARLSALALPSLSAFQLARLFARKPLAAPLCMALLLLCGCSTFQQAAVVTDMPSQASALSNWHISGKVGVRLRDDAHSAYIEWTQQGPHFDLLLFGPLGQGKSRLWGDASGVELTTARGETWRDRSPEALLQRLYGWQLPVSRAQYWVKGLAAPKSNARRKYNADGTLSHLEQEGWIIDYVSYQQVATARLPHKLIMRYDAVRVTLIISRWEALAPPVETIAPRAETIAPSAETTEPNAKSLASSIERP